MTRPWGGEALSKATAQPVGEAAVPGGCVFRTRAHAKTTSLEAYDLFLIATEYKHRSPGPTCTSQRNTTLRR